VSEGRRLPIVAASVIVLGWAIWTASKANTSHRAIVEAGKALGSRPSLHASTERLSAIARGLKELEPLDPKNPVVQEVLGLLAVRGADATMVEGEAAQRYSRSLALRPVSPNTWANLAEAKYLEGDTSAIFEHALVTASRLGPAEPQVQRLVAHYGLAVRDEVSSSTREAIDRMVAAGMRRNPLEMLQIAHRRGRLDAACRHLAGVPRGLDPKWSRVCQSTEARQ
jgi:predicted Zn-dependent protease